MDQNRTIKIVAYTTLVLRRSLWVDSGHVTWMKADYVRCAAP